MQKLMPALLTFFLCCLYIGLLHAQKWQGQVFANHVPIPSIIINKTQHQQTFSEYDGYFKLRAKIGDSISVQYYQHVGRSLGPRFYMTTGWADLPQDTNFTWQGQDSIFLVYPEAQFCATGVIYKPLSDKSTHFNNLGSRHKYHPYQLIQGKIPGVVISRPGGDPNYDYQVQIRGLHSAIYKGFSYFPTANGYNEQFNLGQPLVVVDDIPGVSINSIDPRDIANIEVLKDAASLAAYGMRGANGVIKIETNRADPYTRGLDYSTSLSIDQAVNPDRGIDAATYRRLINGPFQGANRDLGATNDWYQLISRTGISQSHNLAVHGMALKTPYRLSATFREVNGIAQKSGFDQINTLLNFQKVVLKGKGNLTGLFAFNQRNSTEVNPDVFRTATLMNPTAPIFNDTAALTGSYYQPRVFALSNPLAMLNWESHENAFQTFTAGLNGSFLLFSNIYGSFNTSFQHNRDTYGWASSDRTFGGYGGFSSWEERKLAHWYLNAQLARTFYFKNQHLLVEMGYGTQTWNGRGVHREGISTSQNLISYRPLIDVQGKPAFLTHDDPYRESDAMPALFSQFQYTLRERWFAQGSLRREGFTRLGNQKWVTYPSLAIGGKLISGAKLINELRVRLAYGVTGNIPPKNHATELLILPNNPVYINGEFKPGIYYPFVPNPNLQAEQRRELNLGFEAELFKQRLQVYLDVYQSHSSNLLWQYTTYTEVPSTDILYSNVHFENRMELSNRGIEIQLNLAAVQNSKITWQTNLSIAHNRTKLESPFPSNTPGQTINSIEAGSPGSPGLCCTNLQLLENGQAIGEFYGQISDGIDANGQWKLRDLNGDNHPDPTRDRARLGNAQPDLTFGWGNNLQWKQFSAQVFWRGALGHHLMNLFDLFYSNPQRLKEFAGYNIPEIALSPAFANLRSSYSPISSYFVQNASFLRLDNLSIAYRFSKKMLKKQDFILSLSVQNLFTVTSFRGNDPEVRLSNVGTPLLPGLVNPNYSGNQGNLNVLDRGRYPLTRSFTIGARLIL